MRTVPRTTCQGLLLEESHAIERCENRPAEGWYVAQLDRCEANADGGRRIDRMTKSPLTTPSKQQQRSQCRR